MVNQNVLDVIGYVPSLASARMTMATGSGLEVVPTLVIDRIDALGQHRRQFRVLCHTLPAAVRVEGILGLNFLRERRLTVDLRAGLIDLD